MDDELSRPEGVPPFSVELNTWTLEELQTAARALEDIEAHPGWQALRKVIDAAREQELKSLVGRSEPVAVQQEFTQGQYAKMAGRVQGLQLLTTALNAVRWKAQERERKEREAVERGREENV